MSGFYEADYQASVEDGVKEARALVHDWLVILTAQYNEYNKLAQFRQPDNSNRVDATFSMCFPLQALPLQVHFCEAPFYRAMRRGFI